MVNKSGDTISSLAKGLRVIECFGAEAPKLSISDVAARTGLDRATARRCLLTLHAEGYAGYDGKFFTLTHRALRLGMGAIASLELPQIVQPWLDQLTEQIGQSCSVAVLDETEIVYLARAAQKRVMSIGLMPGSRLPAHCTSLGRILLGALPEGEARAVIDASDLSPRTAYSLTDPDEIMARIDAARQAGHTVVDQEVEVGLRAIAVPLRNRAGAVVAALNAGMAATHRDPGEIAQSCLPPMLRVQAGIARILA
ncbi:Pca regulon regulatory protein (plasmid) [Sulfitobacter sp. THAF37]|uniref:IclR family transcriptional regulator domain-containing protein n=1 Tax=Sulfitobacter sp. THAF37 TaxID=2587855 RepID=UPI001267D57E|nr:IclR family transcriptional regulator C-terminal domain-containing protein [Sulfitobacter sp. THAF37]QFT60798.1 Pca regulon regulatory protein [Sulfitobacter sp. THAF37]